MKIISDAIESYRQHIKTLQAMASDVAAVIAAVGPEDEDNLNYSVYAGGLYIYLRDLEHPDDAYTVAKKLHALGLVTKKRYESAQYRSVHFELHWQDKSPRALRRVELMAYQKDTTAPDVCKPQIVGFRKEPIYEFVCPGDEVEAA